MNEFEEAKTRLELANIEVMENEARCYGVDTFSGDDLHAFKVVMANVISQFGLTLGDEMGGNDDFLYVTFSEDLTEEQGEQVQEALDALMW